jgi:hypothetical protein
VTPREALLQEEFFSEPFSILYFHYSNIHLGSLFALFEIQHFLDLHGTTFDEINEVCEAIGPDDRLPRNKIHIFKTSYYLLLNDAALEGDLRDLVFHKFKVLWVNC